VLDKPSFVAALSCKFTQGIFERRKRTDPASEFDESPPSDGRQMYPDHPTPPEREEPARHHKHHESKVQD